MNLLDIDFNGLSNNEKNRVAKSYFHSKSNDFLPKIIEEKKPFLMNSTIDDACIICYEQCYTKTTCGHFICDSCNNSIVEHKKNNISSDIYNQYINAIDEIMKIKDGENNLFSFCLISGLSSGVLLYLSEFYEFNIFDCPYCRKSISNN